MDPCCSWRTFVVLRVSWTQGRLDTIPEWSCPSEQRHLEHLIHIILRSNTSLGPLSWRGKVFGGCWRWMQILGRKRTLYHLKKKLKFLCLFFFLLNVHTLHPHHNSHLKLLKNCWNILWILCMVVTLKEERPLVCVACMLMIFLSLVLQIFWRSSRVRWRQASR